MVEEMVVGGEKSVPDRTSSDARCASTWVGNPCHGLSGPSAICASLAWAGRPRYGVALAVPVRFEAAGEGFGFVGERFGRFFWPSSGGSGGGGGGGIRGWRGCLGGRVLW